MNIHECVSAPRDASPGQQTLPPLSRWASACGCAGPRPCHDMHSYTHTDICIYVFKEIHTWMHSSTCHICEAESPLCVSRTCAMSGSYDVWRDPWTISEWHLWAGIVWGVVMMLLFVAVQWWIGTRDRNSNSNRDNTTKGSHRQATGTSLGQSVSFLLLHFLMCPFCCFIF